MIEQQNVCVYNVLKGTGDQKNLTASQNRFEKSFEKSFITLRNAFCITFQIDLQLWCYAESDLQYERPNGARPEATVFENPAA